MASVSHAPSAHRAPLSQTDPAIAELLQEETARQEHNLELIASENYTSPAVMQAVAACVPTSTPRGILGGATTVVASMLTSLRI